MFLFIVTNSSGFASRLTLKPPLDVLIYLASHLKVNLKPYRTIADCILLYFSIGLAFNSIDFLNDFQSRVIAMTFVSTEKALQLQFDIAVLNNFQRMLLCALPARQARSTLLPLHIVFKITLAIQGSHHHLIFT